MCECWTCRNHKTLDAIAAKCTKDERAVLNELYCIMEHAEMSLVVARMEVNELREKLPRDSLMAVVNCASVFEKGR